MEKLQQKCNQKRNILYGPQKHTVKFFSQQSTLQSLLISGKKNFFNLPLEASTVKKEEFLKYLWCLKDSENRFWIF